ncbi:hypothetical protein BDA96_03G252600 [Sorghum bicolor]|uniref:Uncharacterized protein n=2 Tax=Sorghum bicolor TaxID=4558 RepID=A0A921REL7_SORBI|nr:hypothetical protein BDA96_03G252600 [Sorghum bicolor]OQU87212.1 hypothetical protein SORBI_3003G233266 [Sorghum bicolor]
MSKVQEAAQVQYSWRRSELRNSFFSSYPLLLHPRNLVPQQKLYFQSHGLLDILKLARIY